MGDTLRILDAIKGPGDLKALDDDQLAILCCELRDEMVKVASKTGGHLASSLGAVEIVVALHAVMNCPADKIVYDVGHQAYAHKMLTGRLGDFGTLRQLGGISGFPTPLESDFDVHPSGHASDSLSVALGVAKANRALGRPSRVAAVIGDAALAGGMAFEALNHIGQEQVPMLIVLNDNEMSISRPVGALVRHLGYMRADSRYRSTRDTLQEAMEGKGAVGKGLVGLGRSVKDSMKHFIVPHSMIFEKLGIPCSVPIDGHDINALRETFEIALRSNGPVLIHVVTRKGEGYEPARANPELFHGIGPFDAATGRLSKAPGGVPTYTSVFGAALLEEARKDEQVVAITAAMKDGTGLASFEHAFPSRFIDTGIAEEHAVALASGLAAGGLKPVVAIYSTFLQRALDQIVVDVALPSRNVVFAIDRAGVVGDDGPTHTGAFDIAYMSMVPHMRMLAPSDEAELVHALHTALALDGPVAVRYPRGEAEGAALPASPEVLEEGVSVVRREGDDVAILAFGRMVHAALEAAELLAGEGIQARVVDMRWVKPLDTAAIEQAARTRLVATIEEGVVTGGVGQAVLCELSKRGFDTPAIVLGIPDEFVEQGKVGVVLERMGLDGAGIAASIKARLS